MVKKIYQISTLKKSNENIQALWHDMKIKDVNKIRNVWQDKSNQKFIDEFKKTEKIVNRISDELKKTIDVLDSEKGKEKNKDEIR